MKISEEKTQKIVEQILHFLFLTNPKPQFTSHIAREIARDEEFIKKLLKDIKKKKFIIEIKKNSEGFTYLQRSRWKLSPETYSVYKKAQESKNIF